jgi:hypothetical protein
VGFQPNGILIAVFADPPEDVDGSLEAAAFRPMGRRQRKCYSVIEWGNEDLRRLADVKQFSGGASLARQGVYNGSSFPARAYRFVFFHGLTLPMQVSRLHHLSPSRTSPVSCKLGKITAGGHQEMHEQPILFPSVPGGKKHKTS